MIQNSDIDSKLVVAIHFSHFDPGHTTLMTTRANPGPGPGLQVGVGAAPRPRHHPHPHPAPEPAEGGAAVRQIHGARTLP